MDKDEVLSKLRSLMDSQNFDCSFCRRVLDDPRRLPCGHSYCYDCIDSHVTSLGCNDAFACPTCDATVRLPLEGTSRLRKDILMSVLIEARDILYEGATVSCRACDRSRATRACYTCGLFLCTRCHDNHDAHSEDGAEKHQSGSVRDVRLSENFIRFQQSRFSVCAKHPDSKNKLFCKYEDMLICEECSGEPQHSGHFVQHIRDKVQDEISTLMGRSKQAQGMCTAACVSR